jgi:two-component system chemotaxis sensor kinase CheA
MSPRKDDARLAREFVAEAEEILDRAGETLAGLETTREETSPEAINAFFRAVHSLKGLAGMVGLTGVGDAAHAFEALLDAVRMGRAPLDSLTLAAAAEGLAALSGLVKRVAEGEPDPVAGSELVPRLQRAAAPREAIPALAPPPLTLAPDLERVVTDYERHRLEENRRKGRQVLALSLELPLETFDEGLRLGMAEAANAGELIGTFPGPPSSPEIMTFVLLVGAPSEADPAEVASRAGARSFERVFTPDPGAKAAAVPPPVAPMPEPAALRAGGTVRVTLEKIAHLLDLTGELAIAKNALKRTLEKATREAQDRNLRHEMTRSFATLERTIAGLSRAALATRLVPVDQLAARLSRAARSIAASLGKDVELEVVGGETELDKVLADELADPLLHMLRNAVGHGIETPDERRARGKPAKGRVTLAAETRGRDVTLTLSDDGRGIDRDAVVAYAKERGLLRAGERAPDDPLSVIFLPGFSTAEEVSELSGRGVGLDVVRSRIAAIGGSVAVRSAVGEGTTFEIVLPITLALVESLLVEDGGITFAFPGTSVARMVSLERERVSLAGGREVLMDEDGPVPLAPLAGLLGIGAGEARGRKTVVVAERGGLRAGFVVSSIGGILDLIVKPLPDAIARAPEITGAAELPDGELALTLDAGLLVERVLAREAAE